MTYIFNHRAWLTVAELNEIVIKKRQISIDDATLHIVSRSRDTLDRFVEEGRIIYGVNTGMGGFVNWLVPIEKAEQLQKNLINGVATNVGQYINEDSAKAIMLARINSLCKGNSAISVDNLLKLVSLYNSGVIPCIPEKGSLGTSGDLGPLACIALVCCGQWKAYYKGHILHAQEALDAASLKPMKLSYKEGLALVNGTSGMTGIGALQIQKSLNLVDKYCQISALSFEGLGAIKKPFDPKVHQLKPHPGQRIIAEKIFNYLAESRLAIEEEKNQENIAAQVNGTIKAATKQVEDAYSIRCTPQILGPVLDSVLYSKQVIENELNSSNDNPLILPSENEIYHNGHFHGQYVAMAMDNLSISMTVLCNLSNRRIDRFLDKNNSNGLPPFLCVGHPGLEFGLMGGQFMTASVTAENRSLCTPLSIQSLTSTADFQDIVSFGFIAARRAQEILKNTKYVVAFELLCACQAIDIRGKEMLSSLTKPLYNKARMVVPYLKSDITITDYIEQIVEDILDE